MGAIAMDTILVSNRIAEPSRTGAIPGGLAAALLSAVKTSGATWIGASGKFAAAEDGRVPTHSKRLGAGTLTMVDLPITDYRRFYNGMANGALWPILHYRADLLCYEPEFVASYRAINRIMANVVADRARRDSLVWVHDYHYFMFGEFLRQRGFAGPIGFFLHTPFPTKSVLICLPEHRTVLKALSAYDLIGFQTDEDMLRFRDYATMKLSATLVGPTELQFGGRRVRIGVFPVGINVDFFADAAHANIDSNKINRIRRGLNQGKMVIGVDRLDYSKGLPERFAAYERFLTIYPDERKRVSFLQITPPTRPSVDSYRRIRAEFASHAGNINARFGDVDWMVLRYINESFPPDQLAAFYRISRVGCVTPLRDGMNLVAKEYVAAQDAEDPGVLVLSKFAGAAKELSAALVVNPYDTGELAQALYRALYMERGERLERWNAMMKILRANNITHWYAGFISALRDSALKSIRTASRSVA
ncbi:MAG: trehalose-6-phosphate synthase [Stellaceae bacterium]